MRKGTTRRKFMYSVGAVLSSSVLSRGVSASATPNAVPPLPVHNEGLRNTWSTVGSTQTQNVVGKDVLWNTEVYSNTPAKEKLQQSTNIELPVFTFFSGTFRLVDQDDKEGLSGFSVSVSYGPISFGVPLSRIRGKLGFMGPPIPDKFEEKSTNTFSSQLEKLQGFDNVEKGIGGFAGDTSYNKSEYQTDVKQYQASWENSDGDGLGEDVTFNGVLSLETTGSGQDFLAVGGFYPAGNILTSNGNVSFNPKQLQQELRELMRQTRLP